MRYIDIDSVLTIDERRNLEPILERLESFVRAVPLKCDGGSDTMPTDLSAYFNRGHLLIERYAIVKRFLAHATASRRRATGSKSTIDSMWREIATPDDNSYIGLFLGLEPFCRYIVKILSGQDWDKKVLSEFFKPFRPSGNMRSTSVLPGTNVPPLHSLFQTLRPLRNAVAHGNRDISVSDTCLMLHLAFLLLIERFASELEPLLLTDTDYIEYTDADIPADSEAYDAARRYGRDTVPERQRRVARAVLASRFASTVLASEPNLATMLPVISSEPPIAPEGVTYLTGENGSGKTTRLACMMLTDPPRPLTFFITPGEVGVQGKADIWLRERFMSVDFAALTPLDHYARLQWLDKAVEAGHVAVLFDACPTPRASLGLIEDLQRRLPAVQCIVAAEPADDGNAPLAGAAVSRMQLPGDKVAQELMKLITTHSKNRVDLSHELAAELEALGIVAGQMQPMALTTLLDLLATDDTAASQNYTALTYKLMQRLESRTDIDDEERNGLMQNAMFVRFAAERDEIPALADAVYEALYGADGRAAAMALLNSSGYMADEDRQRTLFEHCHLLRENRRVAILATLAAQAMLDKQPPGGDDLAPLAPHPALRRMAGVTATVPYDEPTEADCNAAHPEMVFRPAPRYIVTQYILNLLRIYRSLDYTMATKPVEVRELLTVAAICGTDPVLDEIFRPLWLAQWLIPDGERIESAEIEGMALSDESSVVQEMLAGLHAHVAFGIRLFGALSRLRAAGISAYGANHIEHTLVNLTKGMTDRNRLELLRAIQDSGTDDVHLLHRICNMIILQMDVPTASLFYSPDVPLRLPASSSVIFDKFVRYPHTIPLLIKIVSQVGHQNPGRLAAAYGALIKAGACKERYSAAFWKLTDELMSRPDCVSPIVRELHRLPFADLSSRIAMRIYSPHVADFMLHRRDTVDKSRRKVVPQTITCPLPAMLMPVSPVPGPKTPVNYISYTVYERESDSRIVLATEALPDTVEKRLVRFDGGSCGYVSEVIQPRVDNHASAYADITIELPVAMELPSRGYASLALTGCKPVPMPYIAAYGRKDHRAVILRVDSPEAVKLLEGRDDAGGMVVFDNFKAQVAEVKIVPFARKQTMLAVSGFYDKASRRHVPLDVPAAGRMTLHYSLRPDDRSAAGGIYVRLLDASSRSNVKSVDGLLKCGVFDDDCLLWGAEQALSPGTILLHDPSGRIFRVEVCYVLANKEYVPAAVLTLFRTSRQTADKVRVKLPYYRAVLQVRALDAGDAGDSFAGIGEVIPGSFALRWYQPVQAPSTALWERSLETPLSMGLFAAKVVSDADGKLSLSMPYTPQMAKARFMRLEGIDRTMPAIFKGSNLQVPYMLRAMLSQNYREKKSPIYYVRLYNADRVAMRFDFESAEPLLTADARKPYPMELFDVIWPYLRRDPHSMLLSFKLFATVNKLDLWCRQAMSVPDLPVDGIKIRLGVVCKVDADTNRCLVLDPAKVDPAVERPPMQWMNCGDTKPTWQSVVIVNDTRLMTIAPDIYVWLRKRAIGGFCHGTLVHRDKVKAVLTADGSCLPARYSPDIDKLPDGARVSYLTGFDNKRIVATHIQSIV